MKRRGAGFVLLYKPLHVVYVEQPLFVQTLGLDDVIKGWSEGLQLMVEGERTRFWIPQDLAYKGEPGNPRGMLVFDVELLKIQ